MPHVTKHCLTNSEEAACHHLCKLLGIVFHKYASREFYATFANCYDAQSHNFLATIEAKSQSAVSLGL